MSLDYFWQAEEITLTVGQAFDLAYKRFLETSNRDADPKKQLLMLQKKVGFGLLSDSLFTSQHYYSSLLCQQSKVGFSFDFNLQSD